MAKQKKSRKIKSRSVQEGAFIFLIVVVFLVFVTTIVFIGLSNGDKDGDPIFFSRTLDEVSDDFAIAMTPQEWIQPVWIGVFVYQFIWLFYGMTLICKRAGDGHGHLYHRPPFIPKSLYIVYLISLLLLIVFLFLWTEELLELSFFFMLGVAVFGLAAFILSVYALRYLGCDLMRVGSRHEITLDRAFVLNGLGAYAAWAVFWASFTFAVVLTFEWGVSDKDASTIGLSVFGGLIVLYFLLDFIAFPVALRYVVVPYIQFVVVLAAVFSTNWDSFSDRNSLLALILLAFAAFALIFKVAFTINQACQDPEPLDHATCDKKSHKKKRKHAAPKSEPESESEDTETTEDEDTDSSEDEKDDVTTRAKMLLSQ